jgi:Ca-activated chloride channel family protein
LYFRRDCQLCSFKKPKRVLEYFKNLHFVHPEWLLLLLLLPAGIWWLWKKRRQLTLRLTGVAGLPARISFRTVLAKWLPALRLLAFAAGVLALARPQLTLKEEEIKAEGIDIFLAMDLSSSMLAKDFDPDRLEVSKRVAADFVEKRVHDRIGLAVFSGEAFTQCPLTTDHRVVREFLANLQCGFLEDGTAIGMGLATAVNRIKDSPAKSKVIILLTDGVNNAGYIQPLTAAEIAEKFEVKVYTIGVGTMGEALTPVRRRPDGEFIFGLASVEIDEDLLRQIADMTGGKYFRATSAEALEQVYAEIDQLEKTEIEVTAFKRYSDEFHWFVAIMLALIGLELLLKWAVLRTIPD